MTTIEEALAPARRSSTPASRWPATSRICRHCAPCRARNVCHRFHLERGRGRRRLRRRRLVRRGRVLVPARPALPMEPHAALAAWDEEGGLTVWASTQNPYSVRVELAKMFGAPLAPDPHRRAAPRRRVRRQDVREARAARRRAGARRGACRCAWPSRRTDAFRTVRRCDARVVACAWACSTRRHGSLAAECAADFDVGAYADIGPRIIQKGTYTATGPVPRRRTSCCDSTRGLHQHDAGRRLPRVRRAAARLGLRVAARRGGAAARPRSRRAAAPEPLAHGEEFAPGETPVDGKFEESLSRAAEAIRWSARRARRTAAAASR